MRDFYMNIRMPGLDRFALLRSHAGATPHVRLWDKPTRGAERPEWGGAISGGALEAVPQQSAINLQPRARRRVLASFAEIRHGRTLYRSRHPFGNLLK
ncbi:MAG: hypothetical protein Kow0010_23050 [Dehalococcoidia bacterium]